MQTNLLKPSDHFMYCTTRFNTEKRNQPIQPIYIFCMDSEQTATLYLSLWNLKRLAFYPRWSVLTARSEMSIWIQFTFTFFLKFYVYESRS